MNTYQNLIGNQILSRPVENYRDDFFDGDKQFYQTFIDSWNLFQMAPSLEIPGYIVALKQNDQCSHYIETSQLIFRANQLTGFYIMGTLGMIMMTLMNVSKCNTKSHFLKYSFMTDIPL